MWLHISFVFICHMSRMKWDVSWCITCMSYDITHHDIIYSMISGHTPVHTANIIVRIHSRSLSDISYRSLSILCYALSPIYGSWARISYINIHYLFHHRHCIVYTQCYQMLNMLNILISLWIPRPFVCHIIRFGNPPQRGYFLIFASFCLPKLQVYAIQTNSIQVQAKFPQIPSGVSIDKPNREEKQVNHSLHC